jgi:hypothetical protein
MTTSKLSDLIADEAALYGFDATPEQVTQYMRDRQTGAAPPPPRQKQSLISGYLDAMDHSFQMGWGDEIAAGTRAGARYLTDYAQGIDSDLLALYGQRLEEERARRRGFGEEHPNVAMAGGITGMLASAPAAPGAMGVVMGTRAAPAAVAAGNPLTTALKGAAGFGGYSAVQGAGLDNGDLQSRTDAFIEDGIHGAKIGGGFGAGVGALQFLQRFAPKQ